ncbi:hypothetical protein Tco_0246273 [Tanacetum coccineum]
MFNLFPFDDDAKCLPFFSIILNTPKDTRAEYMNEELRNGSHNKEPLSKQPYVPFSMHTRSRDYRPLDKQPEDKLVQDNAKVDSLLVSRLYLDTTPIVDLKIGGKIIKIILMGKVTLVDDEGEPVKKVDYPGDHDSEDEVALVDNDMARSMASEKVGFGTISLLEQWRDTNENDDYDYDPYDDDMYDGREIHD